MVFTDPIQSMVFRLSCTSINMATRLVILTLFIVPLFFNVQIDVEHNSNRTATASFKFQHLPSPSNDDAGKTAKLVLVDGAADGRSADLSALTDGLLPTHADEPGANFYFNAGTMGGRFRMDFTAP